MKLSSSYEKCILALAVLVALGFGSSIYVNASRVAQDFPDLPDAIGGLEGSPALPRSGARANFDQAISNLSVTGDAICVNRAGEAIDLTDPNAPLVHPPISNRWWLVHDINPSFANSPKRDADRDGFSNLEEYLAKTNPKNMESHPPLIGKLKVAKLAQEWITLTYSGDNCFGEPKAGDKFNFRFADSKGRRNRLSGVEAGRGGDSMLFAKEPGLLRFELKAVRSAKIHVPRINGLKSVSTATLIDRRPNKDGREYEVEKGSTRALKVNDYTVTFYLDALGQANNRFEVEENSSFVLPGAKESAGMEFRFKEVRMGVNGPEVVIESTKGEDPPEIILRVRS